jgi:hypothetical protein
MMERFDGINSEWNGMEPKNFDGINRMDRMRVTGGDIEQRSATELG